MTETKKTGFSAVVSVDGKVVAGQKDITINEAWQTVSTRDKTTSNAEQVIVTSYSWSTTLDATAVYGENTAHMRANEAKISETFMAGKEFDFELNNPETGEKRKGKGIFTTLDTTYPMDDLITISAAVTGNGFLERVGNGVPDPKPDTGGDTTAPLVQATANTSAPTSVVSVTVSATDNGSGIDRIVSPDGEIAYANGEVNYQTIVDIYNNGNYTFTAYDKAGNSGVASIYIDNIQQGGGGTPMTISIVQNTEDPTDKVILTVTVDNGDSTLDYVDLPDDTSKNENVFEYEITENGFYTFFAYDTAGGGTSASIQIMNIQ